MPWIPYGGGRLPMCLFCHRCPRGERAICEPMLLLCYFLVLIPNCSLNCSQVPQLTGAWRLQEHFLQPFSLPPFRGHGCWGLGPNYLRYAPGVLERKLMISVPRLGFWAPGLRCAYLHGVCALCDSLMVCFPWCYTLGCSDFYFFSLFCIYQSFDGCQWTLGA